MTSFNRFPQRFRPDATAALDGAQAYCVLCLARFGVTSTAVNDVGHGVHHTTEYEQD